MKQSLPTSPQCRSSREQQSFSTCWEVFVSFMSIQWALLSIETPRYQLQLSPKESCTISFVVPCFLITSPTIGCKHELFEKGSSFLLAVCRRSMEALSNVLSDFLESSLFPDRKFAHIAICFWRKSCWSVRKWMVITKHYFLR